jgi:succinoglycan biosynthesis protein ExoL
MIPRIAYFVHDLADPAVHRRVRMLLAGGAAVTPIGFHRTETPPEAVAGVPPLPLGRTVDGMLGSRAVSVLSAVVNQRQLSSALAGADVIVARNLEMLLVAARARARHAPSARLIYECLDVHNLLVSDTFVGYLLRSLESRLWREVDLLVTSSPAFVRHYFAARRFRAAIKVVENKVLPAEDEDTVGISLRERPCHPPWRIGWFGMIRCQRSLEILRALTQAMGGALEVIIRGRPSRAAFPNFARAIADTPHIRYEGPYSPADLPRIYGDVHFVWAVDYYERGKNSAWLLPNRIYEGPSFGAVPIGLAHVETGAWLSRQGIGVVLNEPLQQDLLDFFQRLDSTAYIALARTVRELPRETLICGQTECRDLVEAICRGSVSPAASRLPDLHDNVGGIALRGGANNV